MHNVAFVYTRKAGGYEGIITWGTWVSRKEFDQFWNARPQEDKDKERILEQGISQERCLELVNQTPIACQVAAALDESTKVNGKVTRKFLRHKLVEIAMMYPPAN